MKFSQSEQLQWRLRGQTSESEMDQLVSSLRRDTGLSSLALRVCILRGLTTGEAIQAYLHPRLENLKNPFLLQDMEGAVQRLVQAKERGELVRVYGDYDVDGTTGAALLSCVFREMGFLFDVRQPDRFKDGYGLNPRAVEEAREAGVQVLLTVDCGITSFAAAAKARQEGIDLIVVDHHQLDATHGLPEAIAVINPQRPDCQSGLKQLCGCGLAFYLALALRSRGRALGWFRSVPEPNLKQHLDLVVMATAADMVPLTGDNHILIKFGLEVLKYSRKPGVKALMEAAGLLSKDFSPSYLGFVLGPRINASGRIQSASLALELLTTQDQERAKELALTLEQLNQERSDLQHRIWDEVRIRVEEGMAKGKYRHGIVVADSKWHEGVVGIVASRVTETFRKPAAVIALREDFGKGSVRSYGGKDVLSALRDCAPILLGFGGHRHAAGLSVSLERVDEFSEFFDDAVGKLKSESHAESLWIEGPCAMEDLNVQTLQELERLGPFGPGNPEPVFSVQASVRSQRILKGRHLKLGLGPIGQSSSKLDAIWFYAAEKEDIVEDAKVGAEREWAGVPELNRFRGQVTPTLRVRDWRRIGVRKDENFTF